MSDSVPPEYLTALFWLDEPRMGLHERFGVVTACNPDGVKQSDEANRLADEELREYLLQAGLQSFRVTGGSPDGAHKEPGFGIPADSVEDIRKISRRFKQIAFYWVENGEVFVVNTEGTKERSLGLWRDKQGPTA